MTGYSDITGVTWNLAKFRVAYDTLATLKKEGRSESFNTGRLPVLDPEYR